MKHFDEGIGARGAEARQRWEALFADYRKQFPDLATEIDQMQTARAARRMGPQPADLQGRSQGHRRPRRLGRGAERARPRTSRGSWAAPADLGPSNKTTLTFAGAGDFEPGSPGGRNLHFGIREHAMAAHRQRPVALQAAGVWRDLLHLQRLCPAGHPAVGADGAADASRLHP